MTPSRLLLRLLSALTLLALAAVLWPVVIVAWQIAAALLAGAALLDYLLGRRLPPLTVARELRHSMPVGAWSEVVIVVENHAAYPLTLRVHDHHPADCEIQGVPVDVDVPARRSARLPYRLRPTRRGDAQFTGLDLIVTSPMRLWRHKAFITRADVVKIFPNFREISHYALLATDHRLSQIGVRRRQRRGEGRDFHQLREYRAGDSLRQIDWKATSRFRKLIAKEYQDERDQQVVFLLDCGRRMRHADDDRVHLDQALNAMLLLAYVAAHQGDAVGFMAFGGSRRWFPPQKGGDVVRAMLAQTYDLESSLEAADYLLAARELLQRQGRRALVVLLTNTRDEDHDDLVNAVRLLARRHLLVTADLREELLDETLAQPVRDLPGALRFHAVNDYLASRRRNHEALRHHGAITLDLLARQLPVALVNNYLSIKASGRL